MRPNDRTIQKRRAVIKKLYDENTQISPSEIKKILITKYKINTTIQTIKQDIVDVTTGFENVEKGLEGMYEALSELKKQLKYNKKQLGKCKSEAARAQFSRLAKDIVIKIADLERAICEVKMQKTETVAPIYRIFIGEFPEVKGGGGKKDEK
jgi:archaellum component FlaC